MKYSEKNKPLVCMQTQNPCYKGTRKMDVKGILWHSTGANNPNLKRYVQPSDNASDKVDWFEKLGVNTNKNDFNHTTSQIGLNAWIGKLENGNITTIQTMPWDYRPWGCASGSKGSCNDGWIQFEICEDGLRDKSYFEKVYKEACELTAYLCKLYNINPLGKVKYNGIQVPTILCHADAYELGLGSNHGDVYHWFMLHDKDMNTVRNDVNALLKKDTVSSITTETPVKKQEIKYRVRKTWEDEKSQVGAYEDLENAKKACDKAGKGYEVYNIEGVAIYPITETVNEYKVGDEVKLINNAVYSNNTKVPSWLYTFKMYVREVRNENLVISTKKSGAITGVVHSSQVIPYSSEVQKNTKTEKVKKETFEPYIVMVNTSVLNVRKGAGTKYKITTQVTKGALYTIVDESNGWGKLKSGAGWICLDYVKKVKP